MNLRYLTFFAKGTIAQLSSPPFFAMATQWFGFAGGRVIAVSIFATGKWDAFVAKFSSPAEFADALSRVHAIAVPAALLANGYIIDIKSKKFLVWG